ncbi:MAG: metal-dependent hydrolase [Luteolibacter sp.]|jgi:L-ascorbate metabolism protein UlaG (beta-lactamase superfamily)
MKITYLGHSGFLIETASSRIAIDPFLTGNPVATMKASDVKCDYLILTHGHEDHSGDAEEIAKANDATLIANHEIAMFFAAKGVAKTHGMNPGGGFHFPFGRVKMTVAHHSSSMNAGANTLYMGVACGVVIEADGLRVYHAGDTALFSDMRLIARGGIDLALLPIGDNYTMGPDDALDALELLKPSITVPIHYNTWPPIAQDAEKFAGEAAASGHEVNVLAPGEVLDLA